MKTIEERAKIYSETVRDNSLSKEHNQRLTSVYEDGFIIGAEVYKQLTLEAFDEWLYRNSWIKRDESNRQSLMELRNIIRDL